MSEHLSWVDAAQLERWAYSRAMTPADQERASLAAAELQRRAATERELAERAEAEKVAADAPARAGANGEVGETSGEHPHSALTDDERRHRRRMLVTGLAGVTAAALALVLSAAVVVLNLPNPDPDPMAVFDEEQSQLDRHLASRLESWGYSTITAGPKAVEDDDGFVIIAARVSTVPDGRSTEWDSYCLFVASPADDAGSSGLSSSCVHPEKFEREGIAILESTSATGDAFDLATWSVASGPRRETGQPLDAAPSPESMLDLLSNPMIGFSHDNDPLAIVDEPERLLMGPRLAIETPLVAGKAVEVQLYLREGSTNAAEPEPELCMHATHPETTPVTVCKLLWNAQSSGIFLVTVIADEIWVVSVDVTGTVRVQEG